MPLFVHEKCERCGGWDWFMLTKDGRYICKCCKRKEKELKIEALSKLK